MTDISTYLEHIQYHGQRQASLEVLHELHVKHTQAIPFESLSPFIGETVSLDIEVLLDKFTRQKRGGYCYEHNSVFQHVLQNMGFSAEGLAARVRLNAENGVLTPRSHMLLLVEAEGERFIADTGFGGLTLTAPIRFATDIVQDTPHGSYRLLSRDDAYCLQTNARGEWQDLYIFDLIRNYPPDYEVCNWYTATHPNSIFVNNLIAARPAQSGRHALLNRQYSFYHLDGRVDKKLLDSVEDIIDVLENEFRISTSGMHDLKARLAAMLIA
jgi:N-hydroxyarylamine O-acetyltransferase